MTVFSIHPMTFSLNRFFLSCKILYKHICVFPVSSAMRGNPLGQFPVKCAAYTTFFKQFRHKHIRKCAAVPKRLIICFAAAVAVYRKRGHIGIKILGIARQNLSALRMDKLAVIDHLVFFAVIRSYGVAVLGIKRVNSSFQIPNTFLSPDPGKPPK